MNGDKKISARLKASRKVAGFTSSYEFAQHYKIPKSTYSQHESGSRIPKDEALKQYAEYLNISFVWLKSGKGTPFSPNDERNEKLRKISQDPEFNLNWIEQYKEKPFALDEALLTEILKGIFTYAEKNNLIINYEDVSHIAVTLYVSLCKLVNNLSPTNEMVSSAVETYFRVTRKS